MDAIGGELTKRKQSLEKKGGVTYTLILHQARQRLGLTTNEYIVADVIYHLAKHHNSAAPGWCYASKETLGRMLGLTRRSIHSILTKLVQKGIVEKDPETSYYRTLDVWYREVIYLKLASFRDS